MNLNWLTTLTVLGAAALPVLVDAAEVNIFDADFTWKGNGERKIELQLSNYTLPICFEGYRALAMTDCDQQDYWGTIRNIYEVCHFAVETEPKFKLMVIGIERPVVELAIEKISDIIGVRAVSGNVAVKSFLSNSLGPAKPLPVLYVLSLSLLLLSLIGF